MGSEMCIRDSVGVGHQLKAMGDSKATGEARVQGAGGVRWGSQRGGGRAGGRLKPDVKVTIGGDRPPRLCGDVVTFEDMREFLVGYLEYEQQIHVAKRRWRRQGAREEARSGRFGDANSGC